MVFTGIILFVADQFLLAGLIMALLCIVSWGLVPLFKFIQYLATSPRLARSRFRAVAISFCVVGLVVFFLAVCPFPNRFRAPGVLEALHYVQVVNHASGYVDAVLVPTGTEVNHDSQLLRLSNRELELEIKAAEAQREETLALQKMARYRNPADLKPIRKRLETIDEKLDNLLYRQQKLAVKTREKGIWISPGSDEMIGTWIPRGTNVGIVINHDQFRFSAVVSQDDASYLFADSLQLAEVRLYGQSGTNLRVNSYEIIPFQHERLPSAALGWRSGGDVPVAVTDESGLEAAEPFFQIYAELETDPTVTFMHGRSGKIRFSMKPEPLLTQWGRSLRQLLQKRYRI